MTHLFYVHSNITLLSCLAVIQKKNLNNIVILFGRGFTNGIIKLDYKVIYLPKKITELEAIPTSGAFKPLWIYRKLLSLDRLIDSFESESFSCYLPNTNNFLMQAIISNSKCVEYNIIDEGLLNYTNPKQFIKPTNQLFAKQSILKKGLRYFSHFNRSNFINPVNSTFNSIYLFNKSDFDNLNYKIIKIEYPSLGLKLKRMDDLHVFVFDNSVNDNVIEYNLYYELLADIFKNIKVNKLYVKFHPAESNHNPIISILNNSKINYEILPVDLPLELVFAESKNMSIYGIWSSLLFYASVTNQKVFSYINLASKISPKAKRWSDIYMPKSFFKCIELI